MINIFKFKLNDPEMHTALNDGEFVEGIDRIMWIERYGSPGEFSLTGKLSSGLNEALPLDTIISHTGTLELMIVENQHIKENYDGVSSIEITGRSFESLLDTRLIGMNQTWVDGAIDVSEYQLASARTSDQIVDLINSHILDGLVINEDDAIPYLRARTDITEGDVAPLRVIKHGSLFTRVQELLKIEDLGIKNRRRNTFNPDPLYPDDTVMLVHKGVDRRSNISFSWLHGEVDSAEYLWSSKPNRNAALVVSRYLEVPVYGTGSAFFRRMIMVDATDLDDKLTEAPVGAPRTTLIDKMVTRGLEVLSAQNQVSLIRADVTKDAIYNYRVDYNVGDIVTVSGSRGSPAPMRVTEYAEIQDENGSSGHPTLALLES